MAEGGGQQPHQAEDDGTQRTDTSALGPSSTNTTDQSGPYDLRSDRSLPHQGGAAAGQPGLSTPQQELGTGVLDGVAIDAINRTPAMTEGQYGAFSGRINFADSLRSQITATPSTTTNEMEFAALDVITVPLRERPNSIDDVIGALVHPDVDRCDLVRILAAHVMRQHGLMPQEYRTHAFYPAPQNLPADMKVANIPFRTRNLLTTRLSVAKPDGKDWRGLASLLQINDDHMIQFWDQRSQNPADEVLRHWQIQRNATVMMLCCLLLALRRPDLADLL